jgi:hypothetical protein
VALVSNAEHPSAAVLAVWLETGEPASVEAHVAGCDQCTGRMESATALDGVAEDLAAATRPPADLADRTTARVKGRLAAQESVSVLFEMFSLPFRTASILIGGDDPAPGVTDPAVPTDETSDDDGERTDG